MITTIVNGHVHEAAARELTELELLKVALRLGEQGIGVIPAVDIFRTVHLWAMTPTTTAQEVRTIAAFRAETDARLACHWVVSS